MPPSTTSVEQYKLLVTRVFEEAFNQGLVDVIDAVVAPQAVDHQHPDEPSFAAHLKQVVAAMRTAFPDLHFEVRQIIGEGDWVATYSVMTGTHTGVLGRPLIPPGAPEVPATGRAIRVPHMHMIRFQDGLQTDLLHLMDTMALVGQLGIRPGGPPAGAGNGAGTVAAAAPA